MKIYNTQISFFLFFFCLQNNATVILQGDSTVEQETFFTPIVGVKKASLSGTVYTGSRQAGGKQFSFARLQEGGDTFAPLIPKKTKLADTIIDNPLFNAAIKAFDLFELQVNVFTQKEAIVATKSDEPDRIYFTEPVVITSENEPVSIIEKTSSLRDALGNEKASLKTLVTDKTGAVFAAVSPENGVFGEEGSGIAFVVRNTAVFEDGGEKTKVVLFDQIDAKTGAFITVPKSIRLDGIEGITNNGANAALADAIDMFWDTSLRRLFIALQVTSGPGGEAQALIVGKVTNQFHLIIESFLPVSAVADNNQIVATGIDNSTVSLHKVRTMHTSTGLSYVVVVGNNGDANDTQSNVFALPVVSSGDAIGTLADKDAQPVTFFSKQNPKRFISRNFIQTTQAPMSVIRNDDIRAQVGRGQLQAGPISHIEIIADTVFATVSDPFDQKLSGVYASRALFASDGTIKGWTSWQRATGVVDNVFHTTFDRSDGSSILFTGMDEDTVVTAQKTVWVDSNKTINAVSQLLSNKKGRTQQLRNFSKVPGAENIHVIATADANTVAFINTGEVVGATGLFAPTTVTTVIQFEQDTISQDVNNAFAIGISGPTLSAIGPITDTAIARNTNNNETFLFVGGSNGIAVLVHNDGSGIAGQLEVGFQGLSNGMRFIPFGSFMNVRKMVAHDHLLYVLTDEELIRVDLDMSNIAAGEISSTVLAIRSAVLTNTTFGSLLDIVISNDFALLATTGGLFSNQNSIAVADDVLSVNWKQIILPESAGVPIRLTTTTATNSNNSLAQHEGGNVFVLCADRGNNRSRLFRIAIDFIDGFFQPVLFEDMLLENMQTFFLNFATYNNLFFSDGARYFIGQNKDLSSASELALINQKFPIRTGIAYVGNKTIPVDAHVQGATELSGFIIDQSSGEYVLSSDAGLRIHV